MHQTGIISVGRFCMFYMLSIKPCAQQVSKPESQVSREQETRGRDSVVTVLTRAFQFAPVFKR